jgi:hypothetical protein
MLKTIFIFLVTLALGLLLIRYREKIGSFTGQLGFAEQYLGAGGTYTFILLVGCLLVIGSVLFVTGAFDLILVKITSGFGFKGV